MVETVGKSLRATHNQLPGHGSPLFRSYGSILPSSLTIVLSTPWYTQPSHLCRFGVRPLCWCYFLELLHCTFNPIRMYNLRNPSTSNWLRNINLISIDYAFRPRLRCRLTLRWLALRRKPWDFGGRGSHPSNRYSCQHSHFRYVQPTLSVDLHPLTERSPTTWDKSQVRSFGVMLEPRYIFAAESLDQWAITLSLKDGCF